MFAPVLDDDEDEEFHQQFPQQQHHHGGPNRLAIGAMIARVVKINNILFFLCMGVATFIQFSTLEPRYVHALMWGDEIIIQEQNLVQVRQEQVTHAAELHEEEVPIITITAPTPSTLDLALRTLQSLSAVMILSFLRVVVFPSLATRQPHHQQLEQQDDEDHNTFQAVLADMLFHIQCRLMIGFLACFTTPWIPFGMMEAAVVCVSVSMQITKLAVLP